MSIAVPCPLWLRVQIANQVWPDETNVGAALNRAVLVAAVLDGDENVPVTKAERAAIVLAYVEEGAKQEAQRREATECATSPS